MQKLLMLVPLLFFVQTAHAASLYMDPASSTLFRGDAVTISVRLDVDESTGECVNAVDGVVTYDESIIPIDVSVGKSILPIWVEAPVINKANRTITFAGGIPNGYCGRVQGDPNLTNTLVELVFRSPGMQVGGGEARKSATIAFSEATTVYLNDGQGTKAPLQTFGTKVTLNGGIGNEIKDDWKTAVQSDVVFPEPFSIALNREERTANGKYFIEFNTTDKQSGLSHYEVIEETTAESNLFHFGAANSPWLETRSPYVLKDQSLHSVIRVKAVDKAGNEYIATLIPDAALQATQIPWALIAVLTATFSTLVVLAFSIWFIRRRRKQGQSRAVPQNGVESLDKLESD